MTDTAPHERPDTGHRARLILAAIIVAVLIAVAVDNRREVEVGYVVGSATAPVWVVLVLAGVAGVIIGWLVKHRSRRD